MPRSLSFGRRSLLDTQPAAADAAATAPDATEEFGASFDVPAFLRRQEG
jgi:hypothetical protein